MSGVPESDEVSWKRLCGIAVELCGEQAAFRRECNVLKRLVKQYGAPEVEKMLHGATLLGWRSLRSLGSAEGLGRRMAIQRYWKEQNTRTAPMPERLKSILWKAINN